VAIIHQVIKLHQILIDISLRIGYCGSIHDRKAYKRVCQSALMDVWQVASRHNADIYFCCLHGCLAAICMLRTAAMISNAPRSDDPERARGANYVVALNELNQIAFVGLDTIYADHLQCFGA